MKKILVIEDETGIRESLELILSLEGFQVVSAPNGKSGVEVALSVLPDLILCDINMPEMDGFGVLNALRDKKQTQLTPFIFLTARSEISDLRQGMNKGADDYLLKPFTTEELLASISARLKKDDIIRESSDEKLDSLRSGIALSLPHELRTPLTAIKGFTEILITESDMDPAEQREILEMIYNNALRLEKTTEKYLLNAQLQLLQYDQAKIDKLRAETASINQDIVINWIKEIIVSSGREDDLTIAIDKGKLKVSPDYLKIAIMEILQNALNYSIHSTKLDFSGQNFGSTYKITITDHGTGISEEQLAKIGPFMQFDRKIKEQQGTGLGLILAKEITALFSGEFRIISELSNFTSVIMTFQSAKD